MRSTFETEDEDYAFISEISVSTFDTWLTHVGTFVDEFVLQINAEGFRVLAVEPATVGMVDTTLHKEAFENHRAGNDGTGRIAVGVVLEKLQDVVDLMNDGDTISMAFDQETGSLHLKGSGLKRSLALIQTNSIRDYSELPDVDLPTVVTLSSGEFKTGYKSCAVVSDHIAIGYNDSDDGDRSKGVFFYAEGDNDDSLYEPPNQQVHEHGPARTLLSEGYVKKVEKTTRKKNNPSEKVTLEIGQDVPMMFHINVDEEIGDETFGIIDTTFCIAPRLESY